jgi:hypothetical protein
MSTENEEDTGGFEISFFTHFDGICENHIHRFLPVHEPVEGLQLDDSPSPPALSRWEHWERDVLRKVWPQIQETSQI